MSTQPCGCRVERRAPWDIASSHIIIYCPTHEANAKRVAGLAEALEIIRDCPPVAV